VTPTRALRARAWLWLLLPVAAAYVEVTPDLSPDGDSSTQMAVIAFATPLVLLARCRIQVRGSRPGRTAARRLP
jgi:hypothetical protein